MRGKRKWFNHGRTGKPKDTHAKRYLSLQGLKSHISYLKLDDLGAVKMKCRESGMEVCNYNDVQILEDERRLGGKAKSSPGIASSGRSGPQAKGERERSFGRALIRLIRALAGSPPS